MNAEMIAALRELEREKGIAFETILQGLEEAMASAYKTWWKQENPTADDDFVSFRAEIDPETGDLRMWKQDLEEIDVPAVDEDSEPTLEMKVLGEEPVEVTDDFKGRIGAQTAKQVIFQKLRDAEREMTYEEFAGREGDVVTGIVQQSERRYTLLDLGKVEALLPQAEQVPSEPYRAGERMKAYITEVRRGTKGPQIVVSRSHPGLLKSLFALEVPEIEEGIVEIRAVAREPGHRSKIAVSSNEPGVDPVGACVGPKGSRVRMVVNELRGEKIDVVPWSDNPGELVAQRAAARQGQGGPHRRGDRNGAGHRPRLPALAGDREGRPERPPRSPSDRLADRHQVGDAGERGIARPGSGRRGARRARRGARRARGRGRDPGEAVARRAGRAERRGGGARRRARRRRGDADGGLAGRGARARAHVRGLPGARPARFAAADRSRRPTGLGSTDRGRRAGRGAWVHRDAACVDAALARGGLARALRTSLGADELGRLRDDIETGAA